MRKVVSVFVLWAAAGPALIAQTPAAGAGAPSIVRLTVEDAVKMAVDHNPDLAADRLDPQIGDTRVAAAAAIFRPTFSSGVQRNNQLQPPASLFFTTPLSNDVVTSNAGVSQKLPWYGTSYSLSWTAVHTDSNSPLNSYNPLVQSGLSLNVSQPLLRDLAIDPARHDLAATRVNRSIADTRLREGTVHTVASVRTAYWNLVSAKANVDARKSVLELAQELARVNKAKVDVGQSPPLDLVSAQAEVAADEEQLIIAETAVKEAEDSLRTLVFDTSDRGVWNVAIDPIDSPPLGLTSPDIDAAVTNALHDRADLVRARLDIDNARVNLKLTGNQRLPDVRLNASYLASGLGGTQVLRTGGFPGTILGPGAVTDFGSVLNQLFTHQYPTWAVGVTVNYPIGQALEEANYARARLEQTQAEARLKSAEAKAVQQVRDAGWKIAMNAKRIETSRAARALADERIKAERKRFEVGMSTSFLVIQAQRDLAQAKTNELGAVLAYDLALVDFEALQQAGPAGATAGAPAGSPAGTPIQPGSLAGGSGATSTPVAIISPGTAAIPGLPGSTGGQ
jgi:outer membrane protein